MIELTHVAVTRTNAREITFGTVWGEFYARCWQSVLGYHAYAVYYVGNDIEIQRNMPRPLSEVDAIAWIEAAIEQGPSFLLPLLEAHANDEH